MPLQYCIIMPLQYCIIMPLQYCIIMLLQYCIIMPLQYCIIMLLQYCIIMPLQYCIIMPLQYCIIMGLMSFYYYVIGLCHTTITLWKYVKLVYILCVSLSHSIITYVKRIVTKLERKLQNVK